MFTGLIEEMGTVVAMERQGSNIRLRVEAAVIPSDATVGDSICVSGCCLTVVELEPVAQTGPARVGFDVVPESLDRTNLGNLKAGDRVNLERSLRPDTRMGGHFVTGHVDGTAEIGRVEDLQDWRKITFAANPRLTAQMASKGSVAIDGISLTLVDVTDNGFSVALIPHTLQATTLGSRQAGDTVNVETDLLAKYVQRQLSLRAPNDAR